MDEDFEIEYSPLSRKYEQDGKIVEIQIYEDDPKENGWILEIVDEYGNSVVYDDLFKTDQEALDQFLSDVKEEGIDAFIGEPPSWKV